MEKTALNELATTLHAKAAGASSGRAAEAVRTGRDTTLHHTVIALAAGRELAEHDSPGEATILVLKGRVELRCGDESVELGASDLADIPPARHSLFAYDDSAVLLTIVRS